MNIKPTEGRLIVAVDMEKKNSHTFSDGTKILLERNYDNFNRRYVAPVNGTVISSSYIPKGSEVIFHHNATHDTWRLFGYEPLSGAAVASGIRYFSIQDGEAYIYRENEQSQWKACKGFCIGLRVYKPYTGPILGIEPTKVPNKLYITSGEYAGKVVLTLHAADYEMIFQGFDGREKRIIRIRHFEGVEMNEREEIIAIDNEATELVKSGKLHLGLSPRDAKELQYAIQQQEENLESNVQGA